MRVHSLKSAARPCARAWADILECDKPFRGDLIYWPWSAAKIHLQAVPGQPGRTRITRHIGGFPVLSDRVLLMTRAGREPYKAVTLQTALKAWVAHAQPSNAFSPRARQMLAAPDAAALQAPAYYLEDRSTGRRGIATAPQTHALPLLTSNPNYIDPALPPQAAQALAVDLLGMEIDMPASDRRQPRPLARHMVEAANWQGVAAELGR